MSEPGTLLCSIALAMEGQGISKAERKRKIRRAVQATAEQLGNTPAVCRSSYICPRILEEYSEGRTFELLRKGRRGKPVVTVGLSMEERSLLKFLRQTIADRRVSLPRAQRGISGGAAINEASKDRRNSQSGPSNAGFSLGSTRRVSHASKP